MRLVHRQPLQHGMLRVEFDHRGFGGEFEVMIALRVPDAFAVLLHPRAVFSGEANNHGGVEDRRASPVPLGLANAESRLLLLLVPGKPDVKNREARFVHPLIEEFAQVAAGRLFDRDDQIRGFNALIAVLLQVMTKGVPPVGFPELGAQHVEHPSAFLIEMPVEEHPGVAVLPGNERPSVARGILVQIAAPVGFELVIRLVSTLVLFGEEHLAIGCESFVKPGVRPVPAGQEIAEPMVRKFVGDQKIQVVVERRLSR